MDESSPLSSEHVTLVDTNVLISAGNPGTSKHRRFRQVVRRAGVTLLIPSRVEKEIEQGGVKPALERAQDEGWAQTVDAQTVSHSKATTAQELHGGRSLPNLQTKTNMTSRKRIQCSPVSLSNISLIRRRQIT